MDQFPPYVQKVHLHHNNRHRTNRKGGRVDDTLCASNHGNSGLLVTEDRAKVTCMRCLRLMGRQDAIKRGKDKFMSTVKMGSPEHLEIIRAPLKSQIEEQARTIATLQEDKERFNQLLDVKSQEVKALQEREKALEKRAEAAEGTVEFLKNTLMKTELAYAKLVGYLEGTRDSRPPRMVPEQREGHFASYPDGTMPAAGNQYTDHHYGGRELNNWWNR